MKYYFSILIVIALLAHSCSSDENKPDTDCTRIPVGLTAEIAQTRALNDQWTAGDAIGLCMFSSGTTEYVEGVCNFRYNATATGNQSSFIPATLEQTAYYPTTGAVVDLVAYYPYKEDFTINKQPSVNVGNQQDLSAIDLMSSTITTNKEHPDITLAFEHCLTRLVFALSGEGNVTTERLAGATLTISGMYTQADYNLCSKKMENISTQQDITVPLNATGTHGTAIVLPRAAAAGVSYIITLADGSTFTAYLSDTQELKAGTSNLFRITLSPEQVTMHATIIPWEGTPDTNANASLIKIVTSPDATTALAAGSKLTLWAESATGGGTVFTLGDDKYWSSENPLYWDSYTANVTTFYALHIPQDPPMGNQAPDIMSATAPTARFEPVNLAFRHLMSQLHVVLKAGTDITQAEVESAVVILPQAIADCQLEGITFTPGKKRKDITLAGDADKRQALLVPQTINAGRTLLILTINEQPYYLNATALNGTFETGKSYLITVTVNKTRIEATVSITPWTDGHTSDGNAGMEITE